MTEKTALHFLDALFAPYPPDEGLCIEVRTIGGPQPPEEGRMRHWWGVGAPYREKCAAYCARHAPETNIYVGVLPREGKTSGGGDTRLACWIWTEMDHRERPIPEMTRTSRLSELRPVIIVLSGARTVDGVLQSGLHLYWPIEPFVLDGASARERLKAVLRRLALAVGEPPHVGDVAHVLRVPATLNHKYDPPAPVCVALLDHERPKPLEWWEANLPFEKARQERAAPRAKPWKPDEPLPKWVHAFAAEGRPEGKRHRDLCYDARRLHEHMPDLSESAVEALVATRAANSPGTRTITGEEVHRIVAWAFR